MKAIVRIFIAWILIGSGPAYAWPVHGQVSAPAGLAQLNLGQNEFTAQVAINLFHMAQLNFGASASPAVLDANNFPVANFGTSISGQLGAVQQQLSTTGPWTLGWDAGRSCFRMIFLKPGTASNATSGVVVTNGAGSGNLTVTGNCGQAGSVTINWNDTSGITYQWDGSYTGWASNSSGHFYLVRQSDITAYNSGRFWTSEFVNYVKALNPESIRPMGWNILWYSGQTGTNVVNWAYRKTTDNFSFVNGSDFPPGVRCGGATSWCTMTVSGNTITTAPAADTSLSGWVDGEQIGGNLGSSLAGLSVTGVGNNGGNCQFTVNDTSLLSVGQAVATTNIGSGATECGSYATTILSIDSPTQFTINVAKSGGTATSGRVAFQFLSITGKTGGAKLIVNVNGDGLSSAGLAAGNVLCTYNATLNKVLCLSGGGITNAPPIEAQAQLANLVNANFWYNIPSWANDNFVTSSANALYGSLNSNLKSLFEWCNEVWNGAQNCFGYSKYMGIQLGIATNNSVEYQSLRVRQINGNLIPATSWGSAMSRVERLYCFQSGFGGTSFATGPMQGSVLSSYGYNVFPQRPIDFTESICYAPYVGGGSALSGQSTDMGNFAPTTYDAASLNSIVANYNGANQAAAIATIDGLIRGDVLNRVQTVTASGTTFTTPLAHNLSVNDIVRFTVSGGTTYGGLNLLIPYAILSVPSSTTFTAGPVSQGAVGSAVNAGTAGSGTTSVGYLDVNQFGSVYPSLTIFGIQSAAYTKYQNMAVAGFSPAPARGAPRVRWYEGALEPSAPTTAQCAAISINSTDCATLATAIVAWKNDPMAKATTNYYFGTFTGAQAGTITTGVMANSFGPSWLTLLGGSLYALTANRLLTAPQSYQTYNGFCQFSGGASC